MNHGSRFAILEEKTVIKKKAKVESGDEPAPFSNEAPEKSSRNKSNKQHKSKRHHNADSGSEQKHEAKHSSPAAPVSIADLEPKTEQEVLEMERQAAELEFIRKKELAERKRVEEIEHKKKAEFDQQEELNSLKAMAFGGRKADKFGKKGGRNKPGKDRKKDRYQVHDTYNKTNSQTEADLNDAVGESEVHDSIAVEHSLEDNKIGSYDSTEEEYKNETRHHTESAPVNYEVEESYGGHQETSKVNVEETEVVNVIDGDNMSSMRSEIELLREELRSVKSRNAKLCEVISLSEMGTKNDLVGALQLATKERNEFSAEVCQLKSEIVQLKVSKDVSF